jgi:hypothetical protein
MAFGTGCRRIKKDASANDPIIRRWLSDLKAECAAAPSSSPSALTDLISSCLTTCFPGHMNDMDGTPCISLLDVDML